MQHRIWGLSLFGTGVALMLVHTVLPFLWDLVRIPWAYPLASTSGVLAVLSGFTPPLGALVMVIGGLIYGRTVRG